MAKRMNKTELVKALEEMGYEASMKQTRQELSDLYDKACAELAGQFHDSDVPDHAPEMLFIYTKDSKGTVSRDLLDYSTVTVDEIAEAGNVMHCLAANIMAGTVDPDIEDAAEKRGGIKRLFNKTTVSDADINALKFCVTQKPEYLRECWNEYAKKAKRVRPVTLQRLAKEAKPSKASTDKGTTLKEQLIEAWGNVDPVEKKFLSADDRSQGLKQLFAILEDIMPDEA
jgi:hypothetical protein